MKLAIMQPYFFPYIGYFQLINAVDKFVIYDDVNYINKGWINRNNILINAAPHLINVPLANASQNKLIKDIKVLSDEKWKDKLIKTIQQHYAKAPFFKTIAVFIQEVLFSKYASISELNFYSIKVTCDYLKINTEFVKSSSVYNNKNFSGQSRIIDICKREHANTYINSIGGADLYERSEFEKEHIRLHLLKPSAQPYKQYNHSFVPFLSIIDVMMFCSPEVIRECMLTKFELI